MATINDVCKAAGVSKATVSRVLNGNGQVKESTRQAVLATMQQLGYQPNTLAQALATNTSHAIGLSLPHFQSSYFGSILHHAEQGAHQAGKKLLVVNGKNSAQGEREALQTLANQRCDTIMTYSRHLTESELTQWQQTHAIPLVVLNRRFSTSTIASFGLDQTQLATLAVQHLLTLNHRAIACITSPLNSETGQLRFAAYQQQLAQSDIDPKPDLIAEGDNSLNSGYHATQQLLTRGVHFSAIFACNDDMAIGAIRALHERGLHVPRDIAVVGIDNEPAAAYGIPSLSTVALPIIELTQAATQCAVMLANKQPVTSLHHTYLGQLIVRESSLSA